MPPARDRGAAAGRPDRRADPRRRSVLLRALAAYTAAYEPTWGAAKAITHPVPGNRDYRTPGAAGYFDYFNGPGAASGPAGNRDRGLLQLRSRAVASRRAELQLHARRLRGRLRAGALAARRPRGPPDLVHARLHARRALQLRTPGRGDLHGAALQGPVRGRSRRGPRRARQALRAVRPADLGRDAVPRSASGSSWSAPVVTRWARSWRRRRTARCARTRRSGCWS